MNSESSFGIWKKNFAVVSSTLHLLKLNSNEIVVSMYFYLFTFYLYFICICFVRHTIKYKKSYAFLKCRWILWIGNLSLIACYWIFRFCIRGKLNKKPIDFIAVTATFKCTNVHLFCCLDLKISRAHILSLKYPVIGTKF